MPPHGLIVATKLARGSESNLAARENLFLVQLIAGRRKP